MDPFSHVEKIDGHTELSEIHYVCTQIDFCTNIQIKRVVQYVTLLQPQNVKGGALPLFLGVKAKSRSTFLLTF